MPKLDRIPYFDERSKAFSIQPLLAGVPEKRKRVWTPGSLLDQGREGACVGFGCTAELAATPVKFNVTNDFALGLYHEAQVEDRAMGNNWDEGASVLAGAKAAKRLGFITEYRWCFGIQDVISSLLRVGPVILGINWYDSMYDTDLLGEVSVGGTLVGGHCIMAFGFLPADHKSNHWKEDMIAWRNSWGEFYGVYDQHTGLRNGVGYIRASDLDQLLNEDGEAVVFRDNRRAA